MCITCHNQLKDMWVDKKNFSRQPFILMSYVTEPLLSLANQMLHSYTQWGTLKFYEMVLKIWKLNVFM